MGDERTAASRYFLLYRDGRRVRATDVSHLVSDDDPLVLSLAGREYRRIEDAFIFWDDIHDPSGRTVGYAFQWHGRPTVVASSLVADSDNVVVTRHDAVDVTEVEIMLRECDDPRVECVQGFGHEVYQCTSDPKDCVLLMLDYSENSIGYELAPGDIVTRLA